MTSDEFKKAQLTLRLTNQQMAEASGTALGTIERIRSGKYAISKRIEIIVDGLLVMDEIKVALDSRETFHRLDILESLAKVAKIMREHGYRP